MDRSVHLITVKGQDNVNFYFTLTIVASVLSSLFISLTTILHPLDELLVKFNIPISSYVPAVGTIYFGLFKAWNLGAWKIFKN